MSDSGSYQRAAEALEAGRDPDDPELRGWINGRRQAHEADIRRRESTEANRQREAEINKRVAAEAKQAAKQIAAREAKRPPYKPPNFPDFKTDKEMAECVAWAQWRLGPHGGAAHVIDNDAIERLTNRITTLNAEGWEGVAAQDEQAAELTSALSHLFRVEGFIPGPQIKR